MSVMLYPCMLCVALSMCLFVLCVACLTVFVNCLVKQFAMCLGVVAILLLNVMELFSVCGGALLDRPCMVGHYVAEYKVSKKSIADSDLSGSCQNCFWRTNGDGSLASIPASFCYWYQRYPCT